MLSTGNFQNNIKLTDIRTDFKKKKRLFKSKAKDLRNYLLFQRFFKTYAEANFRLPRKYFVPILM